MLLSAIKAKVLGLLELSRQREPHRCGLTLDSPVHACASMSTTLGLCFLHLLLYRPPEVMVEELSRASEMGPNAKAGIAEF